MSQYRRGNRAPASYPETSLPLAAPFPPMEAQRVDSVPSGEGWQYEPKWDGFRAIVFRDGETVIIQSKSGQPLHRYFPELVEAFRRMKSSRFVLDGEIVIVSSGKISFDDLQLRLHPAESRIRRLAGEIPAQFYAFDLLYEQARGKDRLLTSEPLSVRRERLEKFFAANQSDIVRLSPATEDLDVALDWFHHFSALGLDGVMAKKIDAAYMSGSREGMVKVKNFKEADCVVGGFRYGTGTKEISTLLLGLYDEEGKLNTVGFTSSLPAREKRRTRELLQPLVGGSGFTGDAPGGPSRWSTDRSGDYVSVEPKIVVEVRYDYFTAGRFRHGTKFVRWRPDKEPESCTYDQVEPRKIGKRRGLALP